MDPRARFSRRHFIQSGAALGGSLLVPRVHVAAAQDGSPARRMKVDVCVYGGTSGGVVAAVALAKRGRSVVLVEPTRHLGGMTSGGLGWIDYARSENMVGGLARRWIEDLKKVYAAAGVDTKKFGNAGWVCEPHVAENLFDKWVGDHKVEVIRESRLARVAKDGRRIRSVTLDMAPPDRRGAPAATATDPAFLTIEAGVFIDCSYEGDLMAAAGVAWRNDREGRDEYGESAAGLRYTEPGGEVKPPAIDPYVKPGDPSSGLIPLVAPGPLGAPGAPSPRLQAYNFRLCLVQKDPLPIEPPADYDPKRFEVLARYLAAQQAVGKPVTPADFHTSNWRVLKISKLPRGKTDVNNAGYVSMDFVNGESERYAAATWAERQRMWHAHEDYQRGMLHFLRTDERVDDAVRAEVAKWGLPRDEFKETGGWPHQLYLREVRRMVGQHVVKQQECEQPPAKLDDSIGLGVYSLDSHGCQRVAHKGHVVAEGGFMIRIKGPYPVRYGAIVPKAVECENLLVTFCVSASHASFASIRMEPQLMVFSESAALAADLALSGGTSVQQVDAAKLRKAMLDAGQVLEWKPA